MSGRDSLRGESFPFRIAYGAYSTCVTTREYEARVEVRRGPYVGPSRLIILTGYASTVRRIICGMPTREQLQQLVLSLPDGALAAGHAALTELQTWPPAMP